MLYDLFFIYMKKKKKMEFKYNLHAGRVGGGGGGGELTHVNCSSVHIINPMQLGCLHMSRCMRKQTIWVCKT